MITQQLHTPRRRAHAVPAGAHHRRHRRQVASWALARGYLLRRDALAALLAWHSPAQDRPVNTVWREDDVAELLESGVTRWCRDHGVAVPDDLAPTLATYLRYLSAHRLLGPMSDSLGDLRRAIAENRHPDVTRRGAHPAGTRRAPVLPIS